MSSTSSCRWSQRTTSTGSAGPGAPGRPATRSRLSASTNGRFSARSRRCCGHRVPTEVDRGLRTRPHDPPRADPPAFTWRPGPTDGPPRRSAQSPTGGRTSAAGRTDHGRGRPQRDAHRPGSNVGRPAGAPSHPGHGGPRRGPSPVGIGNAPAGVRGGRPPQGRPPQGRPPQGRPVANRPGPANHGGQHRPDRHVALPGERLARHRDG